MAEANEENLVPGIPGNADIILFVEKIVENVMIRNCPNYDVSERYPIALREDVPNYFDRDTENAVIRLEKIMENDNVDLLHTIQHINVYSSDYVALAQNLVEDYIPVDRNFDARCFLRYCVDMSRFAAEFYKRGVLNAPEFAKTHILNILQEYNVETFRWNAVRKFTSMYANKLQS